MYLGISSIQTIANHVIMMNYGAGALLGQLAVLHCRPPGRSHLRLTLDDSQGERRQNTSWAQGKARCLDFFVQDDKRLAKATSNSSSSTTNSPSTVLFSQPVAISLAMAIDKAKTLQKSKQNSKTPAQLSHQRSLRFCSKPMDSKHNADCTAALQAQT